jgi:cobalt/nickel transport system permease protein
MIGVNTVVNITEVFLGYYAYRLLRSKADRFLSGLVGTVCALGVSAVLVVLIVTISGIQDSAATQEQTFDNMALIAVVNLVVAIIEGLVTAYVITFIGRVRPDLLADAERALRRKPAPTPAEA